MSRPPLRELYLRYGCCMAYVAVERQGLHSIGSAFHVGEGIFVTARHVVEGAKITEMRLTNTDLFYRSDLYPNEANGSYVVGPDSPRMTLDVHGHVEVLGEPMFHPRADVDVAALRVKGMAPEAHWVPLGGHLDDWVGEADFVLSEVLVMGYPPVPMTTAPTLLVARGEVAATIDARLGPSGRQMQFLVSTMPRGGYSGGLAYSEWDFALGVVTQSLVENGAPPELGYASITSVEAIYTCLDEHMVLPKGQWDGEL